MSSNNGTAPTLLLRNGSKNVTLKLGTATRVTDASGRWLSTSRLATQDTLKYTTNAAGVVTSLQDTSFTARAEYTGTVKQIDCFARTIVFSGSTRTVRMALNFVVQSGNQRYSCYDIKVGDRVSYMKNTAGAITRIRAIDISRTGKVTKVKLRGSGSTEVTMSTANGLVLVRITASTRILSDGLIDTTMSSITVGTTITATGRNTRSAIEARLVRITNALKIKSGTLVSTMNLKTWGGGVAASSFRAAAAVTGDIKVPGWGQGVAMSGDTAYIASGPNGVQVVSIADPTRPQSMGEVTTGGFVSVVRVENSRLYVADIYGLTIFDITAPNTPVKLSFTSAPSYQLQSITDGQGNVVENIKNYMAPSKLFVAQGHVFMTDSDDGFMLSHIDATDPAHPTKHQFRGGGNTGMLAVSGTTAATCFQGTLFWDNTTTTYFPKAVYVTFDITTPGSERPLAVNTSTSICETSNTYAHGNKLYTYFYRDGLRSYDLTDISNPVLLNSSPENSLYNYLPYDQGLYATTTPNFDARRPAAVVQLQPVNKHFKITSSISDPRFLVLGDANNEGGASVRALATNGTYVVALREADLPPALNGGVRVPAALFVIKF